MLEVTCPGQKLTHFINRLVCAAGTVGRAALASEFVAVLRNRYWSMLVPEARCALWRCRHDLLMEELLTVLEYVSSHPFATIDTVAEVCLGVKAFSLVLVGDFQRAGSCSCISRCVEHCYEDDSHTATLYRLCLLWIRFNG